VSRPTLVCYDLGHVHFQGPRSIHLCRTIDEIDRLFPSHRDRARTTPLIPLGEPEGGPTAAVLVTGGPRDARIDVALRLVYEWLERSPRAVALYDEDPGAWPFRQVGPPPLRPEALPVLLVHDLELAFPNREAGGARLVLTQSSYLLQRRLDVLDHFPRALLVATADDRAIGEVAGEAFAGRGPWWRVQIVHLPGSASNGRAKTSVDRTSLDGLDVEGLLRVAYHTDSADLRLEASRRAVATQPDSATAHLTLGGACREHDRLSEAREAIDTAVRLAPDWEAAHYECGKSWLDHQDLEQARDAFRRAAELMPSFAAAFSNLGAALGELDEIEAAADAFKQALQHDPNGFQVLNNLGVLAREMSRLDESEEAFRRVIALNPEFAFGHYNLGHTLFLLGRYDEALAAYEEGLRRDPTTNRRQGCRLGLVRFAAGDPDGALADLERFTAGASDEERLDLWTEAYEIVTALRRHHPGLPGGDRLEARISREMERRG
jgi:tetratricopeptide (TPR) repeat protein